MPFVERQVAPFRTSIALEGDTRFDPFHVAGGPDPKDMARPRLADF